jgi:hypothetical protein
MSIPAPKDSKLEHADLSGAEPELTLNSHISGSETDELCADNQRCAADTEDVRTAQARINGAAAVIRSLGDRQGDAFPPRSSSPSASRSPQSDPAKRPSGRSPGLEDNDFTETRPRLLSSLDPESIADPLSSVRAVNVGPLLLRFTLMAGLAATVAYGVTMFPSFQRGTIWPKDAKDAVASASPSASEPPQQSRLFVEDQRAFANEPLALGVSVAPATGFGSILIGGLIPGTRLSAGRSVTAASWELPLDDAGGVRVYAPQNFIGAMHAVIDLLAPTKRIIDSRAERLEWIAKADLLPRSKEIGSAGASNAVTKPIDPHDAIVLMERGRDLLRNGDVALAQLAFRRLADAGIADGALALAKTYDPRYLVEHNLIDIVGDETKARVWYRRASELGSAEADHTVARTDSK